MHAQLFRVKTTLNLLYVLVLVKIEHHHQGHILMI